MGRRRPPDPTTKHGAIISALEQVEQMEMATVAIAVVVGAALIILILLRQVKFVGKDEQLFIHGLTDVEVKNGPGTFLLPILHKSSYVQTATTLDPIEYQVVTNSLDGKKRVEVGPQLLFLRAYDELDGGKKTAISLKATEFVRLLDCQTGQVRVEAGEQGKVIPVPYEKFVDKEGVRSAIALKCHEYVRIEDKQTGSTRVERGEQLVFLTGHEEIVGKVSKAVEIDEETAVLVRNKREGHQRLVTEQQVFVPMSDVRSLKFASSSSLPTTKRALCAAKTAPTASSSAKTPTNAPSSSRRTLRWWSLHGAAGGVANAVTSS